MRVRKPDPARNGGADFDDAEGFVERDGAVSGAELRRALGRFPTGVTVVTAATGRRVHGMTASSFTAVSLDPPLVLVSIARGAAMDRLLPRSGRFGVSILRRDQERLSLHFAGLAESPDGVSFAWPDGVPVLESALAHLVCTLVESHPVGDHTLRVGRVDELSSGYGFPLVAFTGAFRSLQPEHDPVWTL